MVTSKFPSSSRTEEKLPLLLVGKVGEQALKGVENKKLFEACREQIKALGKIPMEILSY